MCNKIALVIALMFVVASSNAWAQDKADTDSKKDADSKKSGDEVELEPDPPDPDGLPHGVRENPDAPILIGEKKDVKEKAAPKRASSYPLAAMHRPLTLFENMAQVIMEYPINVDPFMASGLIRGAYGVTNEIEVGLSYGFGAFDSDGFLEGKTFSIDVGYELTEWASVRASIPILVDPFALGLRIGVPVRFKIMDKLAIVGGHDLISFKLSKFVPNVGNPAATAVLVASHEINNVIDDGDIRILGGIIYQHTEKLAILADIGVIAPDFSLNDQPVPLNVGAMLSSPFKAGVDYGARLGVNLDDVKNTFAISLFAALRI